MRRSLAVALAVLLTVVGSGGIAYAAYPPTTTSWNVSADGTITPEGVNCLNSIPLPGRQSCLVASHGDAWGTGITTGSASSTMLYKFGHPITTNGRGGSCASTGANQVNLALDGGTLVVTMPDSMLVCEVGRTRPNAAHTFSGTYSIVSGTGKYAGATGSGTAAGGDDGWGYWHVRFNGTIKLVRSLALRVNADGTITQASLDCLAQLYYGCDVVSTGDAWGPFIDRGTAQSSVKYHYGRPTQPNGSGGRCTFIGPANITLTLDGSILRVALTGTVCEVGKTRPNAPHTFTGGTFSIVGGTGQFASASGSGRFTGGDDGNGYFHVLLDGTITY